MSCGCCMVSHEDMMSVDTGSPDAGLDTRSVPADWIDLVLSSIAQHALTLRRCLQIGQVMLTIPTSYAQVSTRPGFADAHCAKPVHDTHHVHADGARQRYRCASELCMLLSVDQLPPDLAVRPPVPLVPWSALQTL